MRYGSNFHQAYAMTINSVGIQTYLRNLMAMKTIMKSVKASILALALLPTLGLAQDATLLPNAVQQFFDNNGNPLSSGTVQFNIPNTAIKKNIYKDAAKTLPWTNPIVLNAAGRPPQDYGIYGFGNFDQIVKDRNGNLIWNRPTSSSGGGNSSSSADSTAVGTILPFSGFTPPTNYLFAYGQELSRTTYNAYFNVATFTTNITCTSSSTTLTSLSDTTQIPIGAKLEGTCLSPGTSVTAKTSNTLTINNAATLSTTTLARVFPFGNGNGSTTFNVVDLRGRAVAGRDNMGGTAAARMTSAFFTEPGQGATGGIQASQLVTANLPPYTPAGTVGITDPGHVHPGGQAANQNANADGAAGGFWNGGSTNTGAAFSNVTANFTGTAQGGTSQFFSNVGPTMGINFIVKVLPSSISPSDAIVFIDAVAPLSASVTDNIATISMLNSGVTAGSYGSGSQIPNLVITSLGLITFANNVTNAPGMANVTGISAYLNGLTPDAAPDGANDYTWVRRASDGAVVKVNLNTIGSIGVAGVSNIGGLIGAVGLGTNLSVCGVNDICAATVPQNNYGIRYAEDYGVICDGVTDTSTAMQTAANASAGYKMILPRGVCLAYGITWPSGAEIEGQGGASNCVTTIKRPNFQNGFLFATVGSNISDVCFEGNWVGNNVTATTTATTAIGAQTLTFGGGVPATVAPGQFVRNLSTEPVQSILHGTTVVSKTATTVLLSIPVQSPGVAIGDVIQFRTSPSAELITGGPTPFTRSFVTNVLFNNGVWIQLWNCGASVGACPGGYATVTNSIFNGQGVANAGSAWGIYSNDNNSDLDVTNSTVYGYALNGIACNGKTRIIGSLIYGNASETPGGQIVCGGNFEIVGNTIRDSGTYGSGVEVVGQGAITGNTLINNTGLAGVYLGQTLFTPDNATTVVGNKFQQNTNGVLIPNTNGASITGNHFYTSANSAIVLQGAANLNAIVGNVCQFNSFGINNGSSGVNNYIPAGGNPGC